MRLELFDVRRRWPRQRTQRDDERGFVNSGILFSLSSSVQFVGLILPSNTPLRLCNLPDLRRLRCVTSAHLEWPVWSSSSGNNCHAVHGSLSSGASLKWDLHLVPYYQPSTPARFLSIIGHWDVSHPLSSELQVWSSSRGNNYHAVHRSISSGASLFLRHSENFYLVSHCEPSCILHLYNSVFPPKFNEQFQDSWRKFIENYHIHFSTPRHDYFIIYVFHNPTTPVKMRHNISFRFSEF